LEVRMAPARASMPAGVNAQTGTGREWAAADTGR
jgi:hypothetical protein